MTTGIRRRLRTIATLSLMIVATSSFAAERQRPFVPNPCAAHGPGFAALPGTTTCVRVSGYVRGEADVRSSRSGASDRARLNAEARATLDARTDTSAGPLRSVVQVRGRRGEAGRLAGIRRLHPRRSRPAATPQVDATDPITDKTARARAAGPLRKRRSDRAMLFNSFAFLLAFLPAALLLHWAVERFRPEWRLSALAFLSFLFYGYWDWRFVPLLAASIVINWLIAEAFGKTRLGVLIPLAIAGNLLVLGFFKYFNFFVGLAGLIPGLSAPKLEIALPLGISFFTFHHVMYLVDLRAGRAPRYDLIRYALYIGFFPQVLAGPLVRWSEIMHQFDERPYARADAAERVARGLMLLTVGLAKKVFLGDPLAEYVNPVFQAAAEGKAVTVVEAWQATLGFTFQIYFDFSGYTDMALGLALLFGIVLPQNFDVPYRATSLRDFWRRWHMTLSRFLRDYLYIPLGGSRHGLPMQVWALFATMALGGLWHGAGLTFVAWGVAHGVGLGLGVLWRRAGLTMPGFLGWALTFVFVMLCWVPFRATSFEAAVRIYEALFGFAPLGAGFRWRSIALAALVATLGPTAWAFVHRLPPWRSIAIAFAAVFVIVLFKIGDDANYEFIYFQF